MNTVGSESGQKPNKKPPNVTIWDRLSNRGGLILILIGGGILISNIIKKPSEVSATTIHCTGKYIEKVLAQATSNTSPPIALDSFEQQSSSPCLTRL